MIVPSRWARAAIVWLAVSLLWPAPTSAQYFGRNKVQYRSFDFQILRTDRFDIYYYPEEAEAAQVVARMAERWHARLSRFFGHDLRGRQALILYAAPAHFRQTNAIDGLIGEGTGGVTEGQRRRVVLPMAGSLADTDHVLGHELVHAFQFDLTGTDPRESSGADAAPGILGFPLWFVEGMAEYLSLGPVDTQTSMWLRDSALRERLPHIKNLDHPDYFPYRWGHAFWAFVGAKYGDRAVASLVRSAANPRFDLTGLALQLGTDPDTLTSDWHAAILTSTRALAEALPPIASTPRLVIDREKGGRYNVGPRVSPDGRRIAFFSERDRFSVDLYLASADTGKIERRLVTSATDPHFDSLQFLNSAGAWSPDGKTFAIAAGRSGRPVVALFRVESGGVNRELALPALDDAMSPVFAADGKSIIVSGNVGGTVDLFRLTLATGAVERLTSDAFADLEPAVTPDGRGVVFSTERFSTNLDTLEPGELRLAYLDLATKAVRPIAGFLRGKHISPQVSADGRSIYFVADPDGVNNVYRMALDGGPVERLTSLVTGAAGITSTSPTLSVATSTDRLAFSVFEHDGHHVYTLDPADVVALVSPEASGQSAVLPGRTSPGGDVQALLNNAERGLPARASTALAETEAESYSRSLALDFLGQPWATGVVTPFGTRVAGGMSASFSDMLGDRALGVEAQLGGGLADFGGQLFYVSRTHRWNWAASVLASPVSVGYLSRHNNAATGTVEIRQTIERQTTRGGFGTAIYPFNISSRFEVSGGAQAIGFTRETRTNVYDPATRQLVSSTRDSMSLADPLYLGQISGALVRDTSFYGATAPVYGGRSRLEVGRTIGTVHFTSVVADWRRYYMPVRPVTIAVRGLHMGRYGRDGVHDRLVPLFTGYPEFVHGYGLGTFRATECLDGSPGRDCEVFRGMRGSHIAVANLEVRAPIPGLFSGEMAYGRLPVDVAFFADAGLTWTDDDRPAWFDGTRRPVRSLGGAVRVNVLGLLVVEVAASRPLDRPDRGLKWQVGIRQAF